jgi:hypothetical protein
VALRVQLFAVQLGSAAVSIEEVDAAELDDAIAAHDDGHPATGGRVVGLGWMAAADGDEADLVEVLSAVAESSVCDMRVQGRGLVAGDEIGSVRDDLAALAPLRTELQRLWLEALARALAACSPGADFAWRTNYDVGGSVGGSEEFASGVSLASRG